VARSEHAKVSDLMALCREYEARKRSWTMTIFQFLEMSRTALKSQYVRALVHLLFPLQIVSARAEDRVKSLRILLLALCSEIVEPDMCL